MLSFVSLIAILSVVKLNVVKLSFAIMNVFILSAVFFIVLMDIVK